MTIQSTVRVLLALSFACLSAGLQAEEAVAPEKELARPLIGAIRWDAWFGDAVNPYEKNLADKRWNGRLPFYAKTLPNNEVQVRGDSQEVVDQEIGFARAGGIDYWAFLYYSPRPRADGFNHDNMNRARRFYLSSARKSEVNFCLIVDCQNPGDAIIAEWLEMMKEPSYQTVAGGRPLLYLMFWGEAHTPQACFGTLENCRSYLDLLRKRITDQGLANPYFVALTHVPEDWKGLTEAAGLDALGAYTSWGGPDYSGLAAAQLNFWDRMKATGSKVVPNISAGWGGPRDDKGDTLQPKPGELAAHLREAFAWIRENPDTAESNTVLFYAWNEVDEGGWLVPDREHGSAKLDEIREVVDESQLAIAGTTAQQPAQVEPAEPGKP